jgi:hypothetical protein
MTTTPTTEGKPAAVPPPDIMPDPIDDLDRAEAAATALGETVDRAREGTPEPVVDERDLARSAIAERYKALRDRDDQEAAIAREESVAHQEAAEEARAHEAGQHDHHQAPAQKVRVVVDGREQFVPVDELVRGYQINRAADNRLEEAKRLVQEAKAVRNQSTSTDYDAEPDYQPQPRQRQQQHGISNEKIRSAVERIQVGDSDEGTQAMEELFAEYERGHEQRAQAREFVRTTERQMKGALDRFLANHPNVAKDPDLGTAGFQILARHIRDDIKSLGFADTERALAPISNDVRQLAMISAGLRQAGHKLRSFDEYLSDAGRTMESKFGRGAGRHVGTSSEIEARIERKRAMGPAPRMAGLRMEERDDRPRPKTSTEIVRSMRRARGFPTE